jgi:D-2-hydroxyglutarate dehydrogenase
MGGTALPPRGDFATLTDEDVAFFREVLEGTRARDDAGSRDTAKTSSSSSSVRKVRVDAGSLASANEDWMKKYRGRSTVLLLPSTTAEVSAVLKHCNERRLAVVPQGGNTGLVGGGVPVHDEVIVNVRLLNKMVSVDESAGVVVAEAGVVLEDLESYANAHNLTIPLDLGAKGKCQIGGNVSTNAGGLRLVRYGSLRGTVLGLEIVLADGRVLDLLKTLRKDNTGYDLKQLFIGAEGTLGIITKVALVAPPKPNATGVLFAGCSSFKNAVAAMRAAKKVLGGSLSAFEFLDRASLEVVLRELKGTSDPLPLHKSPFYVVCEVAETGGEEASAARRKARRRLESFAAVLSRRGLVTASLVGKNEKASVRALELARTRVSGAETRGRDVQVRPQSADGVDVRLGGRASSARRETSHGRRRVAETNSEKKRRFDFSSVSVMGYGHLGDGNLHLNVSSPTGYHPALLKLIEPFVYEFTANARGSVSAEHGVGAMKPNELSYSKPENAIEIMRGVKTMLDPRGILNPYKVLPASTHAKSATVTVRTVSILYHRAYL